MVKNQQPYICPAKFAGSLDNSIRKFIHDPWNILEPYISKGMTVLDLGCGPGFFTLAIAEMVGDSGRVIAADLQEAMLEKVRKKINRQDTGQRIILHKCEAETTGLTGKVDLVLAFWMMHEAPDQERLLGELKTILNAGGKIFIIEPKWHVSKRSFNNMIVITEKAGFEIAATPKVFFSRTVLLSVKKI
jgi:ubiquinone/menaquinone biosynthesis C-methylase UbiE